MLSRLFKREERRNRSRAAKSSWTRLDVESLEQRELLAANILITEVQPGGSGNAAYSADWFEVTNLGNEAVDISGWKMDDNSNSFATAVALRGLAGIGAGESAIFFEGNATGTTDATIIANFSNAYFGSATPPAGLNFGFYGGSGVGLSNGGDAVNLYNSAGVLQANVKFGAAPGVKTFDNVAGTANVSTASVAGVNGAFLAANGSETGSPGSVITGVDLSTYVLVGRYDLPEPTRTTPPANSVLAQEVSAVTYNWDTNTLFVVGDGGTSIVQITKTGQLIDSMTLAPGGSPQGTEFYDPEGLTYVGDGKFVMAEERDRQAVRFTYAAGTTLTRGAAQTVDLGTFVPNIGIEGMTYDPLTGGFIGVKEIDPMGIFQTGIDFDAGTATNGSPTAENAVNLFDPALLGLLDFADVFAMSNLNTLSGRPDFSRLLVLSQEQGKIVNTDRFGNISSSLSIVSNPGNPLSVPAQQHEGLTMDGQGFLYVVSENGGGDFDHPQLWVYAPSATPNQAPTAVTLTNSIGSIVENSGTVTRIKVADVVVADDGLGTNNLTVTGADAAFFEVDGTGLYLKAGTNLDFETKSSYSVSVQVDDPNLGGTPDATSAELTLTVTDLINENPAQASLFISEVAAWSSGNSPLGADWFEITNNGNSVVNLAGWKIDDNSNSFAAAIALNGVTSIAPGESVIFIETNDLAGKAAAFRSLWFGAGAPAGLQIGNYTGGGIGLSTGGDALNLYNAAGMLQANVIFGVSPAAAPFTTFNNAAGLNNTTITQQSAVGVNGGFAAVNDAVEIGSPGTVGRLFISEVAPWSSGNSPVGADWFEVTNTTAHAIDITGWKMDDSSGSPAASVALYGITTIAAGESVIFLETANLATTAAAFRNTWFGAHAPANLQIGGYTGGGVGLSTGGDAVNLYNGTGQLKASVTFGPSSAGPTFPTFDNAAALNNGAVTQLSVADINGAFEAWNDAFEIGSPGTINNHRPTIGADSVSTAEDTPVTFNVTGNDADADGDALAIVGFTSASNGVLVDNGNGTFTYTPGLNFNGGDAFTYTVTDGKGGRATATVAVTVTPVNDAPTATADVVSIAEDGSSMFGVLADDGDIDGDTLTVTGNTSAANGVLVNNGDGTFTYTPGLNFNGNDSFTYTISDGQGGTATATVGITVTAVNDAPLVTVPGAQTTVEDVGVKITGISVSDVDVNAGTGVMKVTLTVGRGSLSIATGISGGLTAMQITGNGTGNVVLQGLVSAINATLSAGVGYLGTLNYHGTDTLNVVADDLGNAGAGGMLTALKSVSISVLSPTQQIADLKQMVVQSLDNQGLVGRLSEAVLLKTLDLVQKDVNKNKPKQAYMKLEAFEIEVGILIGLRVLTPAEGTSLLGAVDLLSQSLKKGGGF
jgi:uncharacterized protein YjiK